MTDTEWPDPAPDPDVEPTHPPIEHDDEPPADVELDDDETAG